MNFIVITIIAILALAASANVASRVAVDANGNQVGSATACKQPLNQGCR
jgi:hypothetical protein